MLLFSTVAFHPFPWGTKAPTVLLTQTVTQHLISPPDLPNTDTHTHSLDIVQVSGSTLMNYDLDI